MIAKKLSAIGLASAFVLVGCTPTVDNVPVLDRIEAATFFIEAEGSFADLGSGELEFESTGSGFFIDSSGLAVTANHVVSGAAIIRVFLPGEDQSRSARIVGSSECNDLAIIQVDVSDFPSLKWFEGDVTPGTEIYAAGYSAAGNYTLTRGIVSQSGVRAETEWASVSEVFEHDARTNLGNSGGPVVTTGGSVIGISYAKTELFAESWAISATGALVILNALQQGENIDSIGINPLGFSLDEGADSGVWVTSVDPASAAFATGVRAGDIITTLNGITVGDDGTISRFCEVLRSSASGQPLPVTVLRPATEQVFEGEINGQQLQESFSFASVADLDSAEAYDYVFVTDQSGRIRVEVPSAWTDVDGRLAGGRGSEVYDLIVSEDIDLFINTWDTPGVRISASYDLARSLNEIEILEEYYGTYAKACEYTETVPYRDSLYSGEYDVYTNCEGLDTTVVVLAVVPANRSFIIWIDMQVLTEADLLALDRILETFTFQ
jgi:serine protease Do